MLSAGVAAEATPVDADIGQQLILAVDAVKITITV